MGQTFIRIKRMRIYERLYFLRVLCSSRLKWLKLILCVASIWILFVWYSSTDMALYLPELMGVINIQDKEDFEQIRNNSTMSVSCSPKINVTFFKTHKTASCSIQNIFLRFANQNDYLVLVPSADNYFGHPELFHRRMVPKLKPGLVYNIFCHHHRWNYPEVTMVMPPNTVYITILRDPVHVFESLYFYANLSQFYKMNVSQFALSNSSFYKHHTMRKRGLGINEMSFDLGFRDTDFENDSIIDQFLKRLNEQFDLVMIAERMDESLVLLRNLLCWTVDDVVVFHHNSRLPETKIKLAENEKKGLQYWNKVDQRLYNYFLKILENKIKAFGSERMKEEVAELRDRTKEWYDYCVQKKVPALNITKKFRPYHPKTYGYLLHSNVTNTTCESLIMGELTFSAIIRQKQQKYFVPPKKPTKKRKTSTRRKATTKKKFKIPTTKKKL